MYNSYNPYGDFNSDIVSIVEKEKEINETRIKNYNDKKLKLIPLNDANQIDFKFISEEISFVLNETFEDIFIRKSFKTLYSQERWTGLGYLFIIIYITYYLSKL